MKKMLLAFEKSYCQPHVISLLSPRWKNQNQKSGAPHSTGFCYIAAEAAFHLLKSKNPKAMCASYIEDGDHCTHWWLMINGKIFDPTATQYTELGLIPPYYLGKGKGFLTKTPSKRAQKLIKEVKFYL